MDYNKKFHEGRPGQKSKMKFHVILQYRIPSDMQMELLKQGGGYMPPMLTSETSLDAKRRFYKQMGISDVKLNIDAEDMSYDGIRRTADRVRSWGFNITDIDSCIGPKYDASLLYGGENENEFLDSYELLVKAAGAADIPVVDLLWRAGTARTGRYETKHSQYAVGSVFDKAEFDRSTPPIEHDREEVWSAFSRFCDRIMPACESSNVNIALHPSDPPYSGYKGIADLIQTSDDYRTAFKMAGPHLGMKFCVGCWLEGGDTFGDILKDIEEFVIDNRVHVVHLRNVLGSLSQEPYRFEETLLDNGAADMYLIVKQLVKHGYSGAVSPDHVPKWETAYGGSDAAQAWSFGYMKALVRCAERELATEAGLI